MIHNRLKVAFIAPRLPANGAVGGAETLIFNLAALAAGAGCDVTFLTTCAKNHFTWANDEPPGEFLHDNIKVIRFPVNQNRNLDAFLSIQSAICDGLEVSQEDEERWARNSVNSDALIECAKNGGFDRFVVGPYLFGLTFATVRLAPQKTLLVPCLHDEPFSRVRLVAEMFRNVRGYFFNTESERDLAVRLYGEETIAKPQSGVVGFALPDFASSSVAGHKAAGTNSPYIIYCGRREPLKGTPLIIDYWAAFRKTHPQYDLKLVLTGSGQYETPDGLSEHLIDLGFVDEQTKHDLMAGAVAFCHASVNESLGIVLLESWLALRPVLVHASGTVLREQTKLADGGLWFRDFVDFNECLERLLNEPEMATALGQQGREFVLKEYSPSAVQSRLIDALCKDSSAGNHNPSSAEASSL